MNGPGAGSRAQPFHCPYCAEEDFVPWGPEAQMFYCNSCDRRFKVEFLGIGGGPPPGPRGAAEGDDAV